MSKTPSPSAKGFAMTCSIKFPAIAALLVSLLSNLAGSAERPTFNITNDPRPDILPHPFYYAHTEYRRAYNRPRFTIGWAASWAAPSSQEAMVWSENLAHGNYDQKHMPPMYKRYCAPKPWEVLLTGPRPDFQRADDQAPPAASSAAHDAQPLERVPQPVPEPLQY
jgi:hypothetical protein